MFTASNLTEVLTKYFADMFVFIIIQIRVWNALQQRIQMSWYENAIGFHECFKLYCLCINLNMRGNTGSLACCGIVSLLCEKQQQHDNVKNEWNQQRVVWKAVKLWIMFEQVWSRNIVRWCMGRTRALEILLFYQTSYCMHLNPGYFSSAPHCVSCDVLYFLPQKFCWIFYKVFFLLAELQFLLSFFFFLVV